MDKSTKLALTSMLFGLISGIWRQDFFYGCFIYICCYTLFMVWASLEKYVDGEKNETQA